MLRMILAGLSLAVAASYACGDMIITKSDAGPSTSDLLLAFNTDATGSNNFLTMVRGGGYETAFGQTFRFDRGVLLDKVTFKVRTTQDVSGVSLLLWFGKGFTGTTDSGMSSLIIEPESQLPAGMGTVGQVWYLTLDIEDQLLVPNQTYAFMLRFASGGSGGVHPEMDVGFMGAYSYADGAAFTFDGGFGYNTILNNEMVFFLHGEVVPEAGTTADANGDGVVDAADYIILKQNFGTSPGVGAEYGDFDKSGTVDADDLAILTAAMSGTGAQAVIPEPATLGLLVLGSVGLVRRRRSVCVRCNPTCQTALGG